MKYKNSELISFLNNKGIKIDIVDLYDILNAPALRELLEENYEKWLEKNAKFDKQLEEIINDSGRS